MDVCLGVINGDERTIQLPCEAFGEGPPNEQRACEARATRGRDGIDCIPGKVCGIEGLLDDSWEAFDVAARGDFGDNTAVGFVLLLGMDDRREDLATIADDGGGSFIARGFDAENNHGVVA